MRSRADWQRWLWSLGKLANCGPNSAFGCSPALEILEDSLASSSSVGCFFSFVFSFVVPAEGAENSANYQELSASQLKALKHRKSMIEKVTFFGFGGRDLS